MLSCFKGIWRNSWVICICALPFVLGLNLMGCKAKKPAEAPQNTKTENKSGFDVDTLNTIKVSFYSPGNGINHQAKRMLLNFVENFQKTEETALIYTTEPWGKEGEVDYCISLSNLSKRQSKKLITGIRSLMSQQGRVRIYFNLICNQ